MMVIRPCFVALFGLTVALASPERCCERKTVGDKSYTLVQSGGTIPPGSGCINSCLYSPDDDPSLNVCFAVGNETATCHGDSCKSTTDCPSGWSAFNGKCYKYFSELKTWDDAMDQCLKEEANLASIHCEGQNQFVAGLDGINGNNGISWPWLGGIRNPGNHSNWIWSDGTPWDYSNWAPGQPAGIVGGTQNCVHMQGGRYPQMWNDRPCHHVRPFVCMKVTSDPAFPPRPDWPVPCPMSNITFGGPLCQPVTKLNAKTYEFCGWECNRNRYCQFWTFNENRDSCTLFKGTCYMNENRNFISGEKGCPIHPYTVQDKSYDATIRPCGPCLYCWGYCLWGSYCTAGWCPLGQGPDSSTALTVEHAQMSAALQVTEDGCSQQCGQDGSIDECYNCVAGIIKHFPVYCIKCLKSILMEIIVCLEQYDDPKEIIDCVLASPVPGDCTDCVCDILCQIEPSLCKLCHEESQTSLTPMMRTDPPKLKCPDSTWQLYAEDKLCYKLFPGDLTSFADRSTAEASCEANGGCLVTIDNEYKQSFIMKILTVYNQYPRCKLANTTGKHCVWTSGTNSNPSPPWLKVRGWSWNCPGSPYPPKPLSETGYTNWGPEEPNEITGETAIMMNLLYATRPYSSGLWNNQPPSTKMSYICQLPATPPQ